MQVMEIIPIENVSKHPMPDSKVARHCYLDLSLDGNQWCVMFGPDLQTGVAGFGDTATDALRDFESKFRTSYDHPPIPDRRADWSAWIDGEEESGKVGRGATEAEAIRDLLQQIEDSA